MKQWLKISWMVVFCFLLGCQNKPVKEIETLLIEPELFYYEGTEQVQRIAVDENGLLYTVYYTDNLEEGKEVIQHFSVYDLDGTCIQQVDIPLGNAIIHSMIIEKGILYCVTYKTDRGVLLYSIDLNTWETTELAELAEYTAVTHIISLGDYFYLLGDSEIAREKEYTLHPDVLSFHYFGEVVGRISKIEETPQVQFLEVEFPVAMFQTQEDTLMVYQYTEEQGFGFTEFDPKKEVWKEAGWKNNGQAREMCSCEDGYLFVNNLGLYYGTVEGVEAHIATDNSLLVSPAVYVKGFAFYYDHLEKKVERICITDVLKENREIRLLVNYSDDTNLYGCGYQIKKEVVDGETFSLKVLARDSDFDLYLLNSGHDNSYNIQKNGAFYALNEVPFVQEYLEACFPYLKELAINEDGDIWMIPVEVNIAGIFYDKEYCAEQGVDFSKMNYEQFIDVTNQTELETSEKIGNIRIVTEFFAQYLKLEDTFDTQLFRTYAKQLQNLYQSVGTTFFTQIMPMRLNGVLQGGLAEFFYEYNFNQETMLRYAQNIEELGVFDTVGMVGVPKIAKELKNIGTCTFFAVNPQSSDLEATLSYLSTLCYYLMQQKDTFLLKDKIMYTDTPFMQECYNLYKNGEIYFAIEREVYTTIFEQYLEGELELEEAIEEMERKRKIYVEE